MTKELKELLEHVAAVIQAKTLPEARERLEKDLMRYASETVDEDLSNEFDELFEVTRDYIKRARLREFDAYNTMISLE